MNGKVKLLRPSSRTEGSGLEPQWLIKPLDRFSRGVQYPLEIPSRQTREQLQDKESVNTAFVI